MGQVILDRRVLRLQFQQLGKAGRRFGERLILEVQVAARGVDFRREFPGRRIHRQFPERLLRISTKVVGHRPRQVREHLLLGGYGRYGFGGVYGRQHKASFVSVT